MLVLLSLLVSTGRSVVVAVAAGWLGGEEPCWVAAPAGFALPDGALFVLLPEVSFWVCWANAMLMVNNNELNKINGFSIRVLLVLQ